MFFIYRLGGGGASRTFLNIINHIDREKFTPILVTLDFTYNYEQYVKDDVIFIKLPTKRLRKAIKPLAKLIKEERPDLLMSTIPVYNTVLILANMLSRTKTKIVVREAAHLGGTWKENMKLKLFGKLYNTTNQVIALSQGVKTNLINRYKVKDSKIKVIYNPVDIEHIVAESEQAVEQKALFSNSHKKIITAGRLVKEKDQDTLIKAFAKVTEETNSELYILGEGELETDLKQLTEKLNVAHKVHFLGFQENPYAYFKEADVFALTSLTEGFGHVFVEALALGLPIVTTKCEPGASEVLQNGKYGYVANVGDVDGVAAQLGQALLLEGSNKEQVINKGKERAADFHVEKIVSAYEKMFQAVIGEDVK